MTKKLKGFRRNSNLTKIQILIILSEKYPEKLSFGEVHNSLEEMNKIKIEENKFKKRKFDRMNTKRQLTKMISEDLVKEGKNGFTISKKVVKRNEEWKYWILDSYRGYGEQLGYFYWMLKDFGLVKEPKVIRW